MKVHHAPNSRSVRAFILLNELEVPYDLEIYPGTRVMRSPEYLKIHPLGRRLWKTRVSQFLNQEQ